MIKILIALFLLIGTAFAQQVIKDLTVQDFKVVSTVNGSKPCPLITDTQKNAIVSPLSGQCVYSTTTNKLNVYNGSLWKAAGGGVDSWTTSIVYAVDDLVIQSNLIYKCLVAHTSGTFATDLGASKWIEVSAQVAVNLTGPITSVGAATSIASQTGTGTTFVVQNTPTLTTPNIGAATGTSLALAGNITAYNYDKDNLLVNGNIENPLSSEWTCTVGTCTRTTVSGEFSKDTAALKVALSSQAMNISQTVNTPLGIQKQGYIRVLYRVPVTMADFQICSIVNSVEQNCVPTNNLIKDDTFRSIEIPLIFNATNAGIKFKTTTAYTGNAFFDAAVVAQGLGTQNLMLDNVYSAYVSSTGVVSSENKEWINGNCSVSGTGVYSCTMVSSIFSVLPNCTATPEDRGGQAGYDVSGSTTSILKFATADGGGSASARNFTIICQKSGNDYLASSANVYSQASANTDWTDYTPTISNLGTTSPSTLQCKHKRSGGDLEVNCSFTVGIVVASLFSITLPNSLTLDSARITATNTTATAGQKFGWWNQSSSGLNGNIVSATGTSTSLLYWGTNASNNAMLTPSNGSTANSSEKTSIYFKVPISGWSNSSVIVGSFAGVPAVSGYQGDVDTFSVSYGTTVNNDCTASPCGFLDQIGSAVTSITRSSVGSYVINTPKTYAKLFCTADLWRSGLNVIGTVGNVKIRCLSTNACSFGTEGADTHGNLNCIGSY